MSKNGTAQGEREAQGEDSGESKDAGGAGQADYRTRRLGGGSYDPLSLELIVMVSMPLLVFVVLMVVVSAMVSGMMVGVGVGVGVGIGVNVGGGQSSRHQYRVWGLR